MAYREISSAQQLYQYGADLVMDRVKDDPIWGNREGSPNLYELTGEYEWIKPIMRQYNLLGFFTRGSQPGDSYPVKIHSSHHDFMTGGTDYLEGNYTCMQRANVGGFMLHDMAQYVSNAIESDLRISSNDIKYITAPFKDGVLMEDECNKVQQMSSSYFQDGSRGWHDAVQKHNDFKEVPHVPVSYFIDDGQCLNPFDFPLLDTTQFKYINICDIHWNDNSYLWTKLLDVLTEYHKTTCAPT